MATKKLLIVEVTGKSGDNKKISWQGLYSYGVYGAYNRPSEKSNGYRL